MDVKNPTEGPLRWMMRKDNKPYELYSFVVIEMPFDRTRGAMIVEPIEAKGSG